MRTNHGTKFWAFLLAFAMLMSMVVFPSTAHAEGEASETGPPLLSNLSVKCGETELLEGFSSETFSYTIGAEFSADKVTIAASPAVEGDTIDGLGEFPLAAGENVFKVTVSRTAEGADPVKQEYVITINRAAEAPPDDCSLKSLTVTAGGTALALVPAFDPAITEYTAAAEAGPVDIAAEANGQNAQVSGLGTFDIAEGGSVFKVTVTAENGDVREYNITVTPASGISAAAASDFTYTVTDGKATITGYTGFDGVITLPAMLGGYQVTAIGAGAFANNATITSVTIPSGVTEIGDSAFYRAYFLTTVGLPATLKSIGENAFYNTPITAIYIPRYVDSIGATAFNFCYDLASISVNSYNTAYSASGGVLFNKNKTTIVRYPNGKTGISYAIPSSVTVIGASAFEGCEGLESITISGSVTEIGAYAFASCYSLENITLPNSVTSIGRNAFEECYSLVEFTVPEGVTEIGMGAFYDCSSIVNIDIPDGLVVIGPDAFLYCTDLLEIDIPASVETIGSGAFARCSSLMSINVDALNENYTSEGGVLFDSGMTTLIQYPAGKSGLSYSIPAGITAIGNGAFSDSSLREVVIPNGVETIGNTAFLFSDIWSVEIPASVTQMDFSFPYCYNLTEAVFLGDCPTTTEYEFVGCSELVIYYATGKTGFTAPWHGYTPQEFNPTVGNYITYDANGAESGSVPSDSNAHIYAAPVTMPGNTGGLAKEHYTFTGWNTMPDGSGMSCAPGEIYAMGPCDVTLYADWQSECKLEVLRVFDNNYDYLLPFTPEFSPDVYEYTLSVSNEIDEICIDAWAVLGDDWADWYSDEDSGATPLNVGVNNIEITVSSSDGRTERIYTIAITRYAATDLKTFGYFKYINEEAGILITKYTGAEPGVIVPDVIDFKPVTRIGATAFIGNSSIRNVILPDSITEIGRAAFRECYNLEDITLPASLKSIGDEAFSYCSSLKSFTVPDSVTYIGAPFLEGCPLLATINTGANPNFTVENGVLFDAEKTRLIRCPAKNSAMPVIEDVGPSYTIPITVTDIDETAFDSAWVGSVTIPEGVTELFWKTFENCEKLSSVTIPDTLTDIYSFAFYNCTGLRSINLPRDLSYFYGDAFYGCTGLDEVTVTDGGEYYWDLDGVVYCYDYYFDEDTLAYYPAAKRNSLGEPSFTVPSSILGIREDAFVTCGLEQIDLGSGVYWIDWEAFVDCDRLTSVTIPDNIEEIYSGAFIDCDNLSTATMGYGTNYIAIDAFYDCPKLAAVYFLGDAPYVETGEEEDEGFAGMKKKAESAAEHAPRELKSTYNGMVKTLRTIKARALADTKLFPGSSSSFIVYRAYGTAGYTNPWYGRPVKTFYDDQTCTVSFNLNGKAADPIDSQTVYKYGKAAQPLNPANPDNRFLGWYREASCVNRWDFAVNTVSANITLYAKWTNTSVITVKPSNRYYGTAAGGTTVADGTVVTVTATPKQGYRFLYWTETLNGVAELASFDAKYAFTATESRTLTAQFAAIGKPVITSIYSTAHNSATLWWSAVDGAIGYNIYRATSYRGTYLQVGENLKGEITFTDTGLQWGKTYYYKVSAVCNCDTARTVGARSAYKSVKVKWQAPTLTAAPESYYGVTLNWTEVDGADAYYVWMSTYNGGYEQMPEKVYGLNYLAKGMPLGRTYYFKVQAVDETKAGEVPGPLSAYKSARAGWEPIKLTATAAYDKVKLNWNNVKDADSYYVWVKSGSGDYLPEPDKVRKLEGKDFVEYEDFELTPGVTYYYRVQPVDEELGREDVVGPLSACKYAKTAWPTLTLKAAPLTYNGIILKWNAIYGADAYDIYRGTSYKAINECIKENLVPEPDATSVEYEDKGLEKRTYYYRVVPKTFDGKLNLKTMYRYSRPGWQKVKLTAAPYTYDSIKLTWNEVKGEPGYRVQRYNAATRKWDVISLMFDHPAEGYISCIDTGLKTGATYYYKIRAYVSDTEYTLSAYRYAKPAWPTLKLTAASDGYNSIALSWNRIQGADVYEVYRNTTYTGTFTFIGDSNSPECDFDGSTYTFTGESGLDTGRRYYYRVIPRDSVSGKGNPSTALKYATPVPSAPVVTLGRAVTGGITGRWAAVDGASGYEVYRATSLRGTYYKLITTAGLGFWDVTTTLGRTYYYKVRAFRVVGTTKVYGAFSAIGSWTDLPTE